MISIILSMKKYNHFSKGMFTCLCAALAQHDVCGALFGASVRTWPKPIWKPSIGPSTSCNEQRWDQKG